MGSEPPTPIRHESEVDWKAILATSRRVVCSLLQPLDGPTLDDLSQQVAIEFLRTLRREPIESSEGMLVRIASFRVKDEIRRRRMRSARYLLLEDPAARLEQVPTPEDDETDPWELLWFMILEFFRRRDAQCMELARLYEELGSWDRAAEELDIQTATARKRWSRCAEKIPARLRESWRKQLSGDIDRTDGEHAWVRERIAEHVAWLLDEVSERRFAAHLESCAECAALVHRFEEASMISSTAPGHIPSGIIARWDRARRRLHGVARRYVREHLQSCEACRQELELLGYRAELPFVPGLDDADAEEPADPAMAPTANVAPRLVVVRRTAWRGWAGGIATGIAASLLVVWMRSGVWTTPERTPTGAPSSAPPHVVELPGSGVFLGPIVLSGRERGGSSRPTTVERPAGADGIAITVPPFALDGADSARVTWLDARGRLQSTTVHAVANLEPGALIVLHGVVVQGEQIVLLEPLKAGRALRADTTHVVVR